MSKTAHQIKWGKKILNCNLGDIIFKRRGRMGVLRHEVGEDDHEIEAGGGGLPS